MGSQVKNEFVGGLDPYARLVYATCDVIRYTGEVNTAQKVIDLMKNEYTTTASIHNAEHKLAMAKLNLNDAIKEKLLGEIVVLTQNINAVDELVKAKAEELSRISAKIMKERARSCTA